MTPRRALLSKVGIALSAFGLVGWNQNQVGVDPGHIAQWGNGTVNEPILVNRDNPWLQGWFNTPGGNWSNGIGQYSHQYSGSCVGTIRTYEFGPPPFEVDDWATPMRPVSGSQYTGGWIGNQLNWAVRSGNFIPENSYAVAQAHLCSLGLYSSPSATWFKLAPDVLVVPVVLISWIKTPSEAAGSASEQDFLARGRALIDYIPFKGSYTNSAPNPWNAANTAAPEAWYEPPDDIWTQCGIQFQVVAEFKFDAEFEQSPCNGNLQDMVFAEEDSIRDLVSATIGEPAKALLLDQLQPAFAEFGFAHCLFRGKTSRYVHAQIDREDSDQATVLAHEFGHILLGPGHVSDPANLMCDGLPCDGHTLTPYDCTLARTKAAEFAERFRAYNVKVKRVPASNPFTPIYPDPNIQDPSVVSFQWTCCDNGGGKYWAPMMMCPGSALPDAACTECCVVSESPVDVEFMRLGTCGGATMAADQCNLVCCSMGAWTGFVAQAECQPNGGVPLEREYCL